MLSNKFHDNCIYAIRLVSPEPDQQKWISELHLDIDHILEWRQSDEGGFSFLINRAMLVFEDVSDLKMSFGFPGSTITQLPINRVERSAAPVVSRGGDYHEYQWTVSLSDLAGGEINMRASGYRLELIGEPVACDQQQIPADLRENPEVGKAG